MTALCVRVGPPDGVLTALEEGVRAHLELDVHAAADAARALELIEGSAADPLLLIAHGHPPSHEGFPDLRCDGGFFASGRVARAMRGRALLVFACWSATLPTRWQLRPRAYVGFEGWLLVGRAADRAPIVRELFEPVGRALVGSLSLQDLHAAWQIAATRAFADHPATPAGSVLPEMLAHNARAARVAPRGVADVWLTRA